MQLTQAAARKLDTFQLKGLRKILKLETTYINREYSNDYVFEKATQLLRAGATSQDERSVERLSHSYEKIRIKLFVQLILAKDKGDPKENVTFAEDLRPHNYGKKRVGRPRLNWINETTRLFWNTIVKPRNRELWLGDYNPQSDVHYALMKSEATAYNQQHPRSS